MRTFDPGPITKSRRVTKLISETEWANALERHCRSDVEAYLQGDIPTVETIQDTEWETLILSTDKQGTRAWLLEEWRAVLRNDVSVDYGDLHDAQTGEFIRSATVVELRQSLEAALSDGGHGAFIVFNKATKTNRTVRVVDETADARAEALGLDYDHRYVAQWPPSEGLLGAIRAHVYRRQWSGAAF